MLRSVTLNVRINKWPMGPEIEDDFQFLLCLQRRWRVLTVVTTSAQLLLFTLDTFKPQLSHLTKLVILQAEYFFERPPTFNTPITIDSLKEIDVPFFLLPTLSEINFLDSITNLHITETSTSRRDAHWHLANTLRTASDRFSHILSSLPRLTSLSVDYADYSESEKLPKIKSSTLRSLEVKRSYDNLIPYLALFSECPIDDLEVHYEEPMLERLGKIFPGLKRLAYVSSSP